MTSNLSILHLKLFSSSGHPTFKCPLCQESNFTRQRLLDHCNSNHLFQIVPVVSTYVEDSLLLKVCAVHGLSLRVNSREGGFKLEGALAIGHIFVNRRRKV